ncbi:MAG: hypothetical protein IT266_01925 [Saprospiraceae bacterium]|nr:hypothetical protein [Saprospiraceae bacterium]
MIKNFTFSSSRSQMRWGFAATAVLACALFNTSQAQTWQTFTPPFRDTLGIYDIIAKGSQTAWFLGFRFGEENTAQIAGTVDGGASFNVVDIPIAGVPYTPCMAITGDSTLYVMALQNWGNAVTLKSTDGGKNWVDTKTPWDPTVSWPDYIHAFSDSLILQIGDPRDGEFEIYRSKDAGASWTRIDGAEIPDPRSGEFGFNNCGDHSGSHIWFGTNQGRLYHSADAGSSWEAIQTPIDGLGGLSFSDEDHGIIVGTYGIVDSVQTLAFVTEDGGRNWTEISIPVGTIYHYYGVPFYFKNSSVIVATTYTNPQLFGVNQTWVSFDRGANWILYSEGEIAAWPEFTSSRNGWAGEFGPILPGEPTKVFRYVGQALVPPSSRIWQAYDPGYTPPNLGCSAIEVLNPQTVWALHAHYSVNDSLYGFFVDSFVRTARTTDGGATWQTGFVPVGNPAFVANLCAIDAQTAWVAGIDASGGGSKILKTEDGGKTWNHLTAAPWDPVVSWVNFVHFWSPAKGVTMGDPRDSEFEIYLTGNGGQFWSRVPGDKIPDPLPGEFGYNNDFDVLGNTIWFGTNKGRVFRSDNAGASWQVYETGLPDGSLEFGNNGHGIFSYVDFSNSKTELRISRDRGETWTELNGIPEGGNFRMNSLEFVPGSNVIVMTTTNASLLHGLFRTWISADDGTTWKEIDQATNVGWMEFSSPSTGWGGQPQVLNGPSYLFKYTGSVLTGLLTAKALEMEVQAWPNPVHEQLHLSFRAPEAEDFILLLNDAQGKLIERRLLRGVSMAKEVFETQHLPAGNYHLTVASASGSKSLAIIVH